MWSAVKGILSSRKALAMIVGVVASLVAKIGWDISSEELLTLVSPVIAYILAQGVADHGKEAKKVENK